MKLADEERELTRLLQGGAAPPLVVDALRAQGPDATELASLANRLALRGIDVSVGKPAPAAPARWPQWALAGGAAALGGLTWLALSLGTSRQPVAAASRSVIVEPTGAPTLEATPGRQPAAPVRSGAGAGAATAANEQTPSGSAAPSAASPESPAATPEKSEPSVALHVSEAQAPSAKRTPSSTSIRPTNVPAERAPSEAAAATELSGPSELSLLRDARLALAQSPARALELVEQHRRLYPGGKLSQERELIAMRALVAQGRRTAALERASAFERAFPQSPYRKQVSDLLR